MADTSNKPLLPTDQKVLKNLVSRRHPEYARKESKWDFMYDTYLGTREWFDHNIFRFNREGPETYKGRVERAYRFNHTREVVDLVNKYLFKIPPLRDPEVDSTLAQFRTRATLSGLSLNEFERQVGRAASIFGRVYVVVDNNYADRNPVSIADAREMDSRLYAYLVQPENFLDCGFDEDGQFEWVLLQENHRDDNNPFTSSGDVMPIFRLWTKQYWVKLSRNQRGRVSIDDSGFHDLGVVPVVKCDHIESAEKYTVPALIEDIAYLDRAVANYLSNLDQIINDQTFSQLVMPAQSVLGGMPSGVKQTADGTNHDEMQRQMVKMGTSQILVYDGEHGQPPAYISPDPHQAQMIVTAVKQIINEIYHTVGLAGERTKSDNSMGIDNSSGVAKAYDFERVNALLSAKGNAMQSFSNRLETLVRIYGGEKITFATSGNDTVLYSMNFDVRNLVEDLSVANELALMQAPMPIRRMQMKSVVDKLWPLVEASKRKEMDAAIDAWDDSLNNSLSTDLVAGMNPPEGGPGQGAVGGKQAASKVGN